MKISICISTYKRPDLLQEAISSCLAQTLLPAEIIIGDNSPDDDTQVMVAQLALSSKVAIRYIHHVPGLTQAPNVHALFNSATTELLLLLHDDDVLLPTCLQDLYACFIKNPAIDAAFGKQYLMSFAGEVDYATSEKWNEIYYKTPDYEGQVLSAIESAILQQFPNNSYLIRSSIAKSLGYIGLSSHACDFEFSLNLALNNYTVYFTNAYTTKARISENSLSRDYNNNGALVIFQLVNELNVPQSSLKYKHEVLSKYASIALAQSANLKLPRAARKVFFSKWHWNTTTAITAMKGVYHLIRAHL